MVLRCMPLESHSIQDYPQEMVSRVKSFAAFKEIANGDNPENNTLL
jgi:hypothetical protein